MLIVPYRGVLLDGTDVDTVTDFGFYDLSGVYQNCPFKGGTWGQLIVLGKINNSQFITQLTSTDWHGFIRQNIDAETWTQVF